MTNEQIQQQAISLYRQKQRKRSKERQTEAIKYFKFHLPPAIYLPEEDKFYLGGEKFGYFEAGNWYLYCDGYREAIYDLEDYGEYLISKGNHIPTLPENITETDNPGWLGKTWLGKLAAKIF